MFFSTNSSSSTKNVHDPFCYFPDDPDHSFHLPISFFPFPSPFDVDVQFDEYDFMFHDQQPHNFTPTLDKTPPNTNTNTNMDILNSDQKKKLPRKRLSKKDRHSKITTARGLRDRRMRLSLPVARQFFGLQDMLGVDKASKTVEWLLIQARPQILKLAKDRNICSLMILSDDIVYSNSNINSEPDMVSGIDEAVNHHDHEENGDINFVEKIKSLNSTDGKKKKRVIKQQPRKTMAKEMRELARARARARTMEKKNQDFDHNLDKNFNKISSCSWSSPPEESGGTNHSYNLNPAVEVEKPITSQSQPIIDYQLQKFSSNFEIMAKWSPSYSTFNYLHHQTDQNLVLQEQNEFVDSGIFG